MMTVSLYINSVSVIDLMETFNFLEKAAQKVRYDLYDLKTVLLMQFWRTHEWVAKRDDPHYFPIFLFNIARAF